MAQLSKPPIPNSMYRHFAIVTVAITSCIALFADGENEEFYAERAAEQRRQVAADERSREEDRKPRYGEAQIARRDGASAGSFGTEANFSGGYGQSTSINSRFQIDSTIAPAGNSENAAFTASYLDKLSEEELEQLLRELEEGGIENATERSRAMAVLEAASRRRSGHREHNL